MMRTLAALLLVGLLGVHQPSAGEVCDLTIAQGGEQTLAEAVNACRRGDTIVFVEDRDARAVARSTAMYCDLRLQVVVNTDPLADVTYVTCIFQKQSIRSGN